MKRRELLKRGLAIVLAATLTLGSTITAIAEEPVQEITSEAEEAEEEVRESAPAEEAKEEVQESAPAEEAKEEVQESAPAEEAKEDVQESAPAEEDSADNNNNQFDINQVKALLEAALKGNSKDADVEMADGGTKKVAEIVAEIVDYVKGAYGNAQDDAKSYADWATALVAKHVVRTYAQSGSKNGTDYYTENERKFDLKDDLVKPQGVENFSEVSPVIEGTKGVDVPYTIYRDYVKAMYNNAKYTDLSNASKTNAEGKGAATGSGMSVIYWETTQDEVGKITLTGNYYTDEAELTTGTYFVGYSFKHHAGDGYHLDGLMYNYVAPAPSENPSPSPEVTDDENIGDFEGDVVVPSEEPSESPSASPSPSPEVTDDENIADFEGDVVVIEDSPVALAAPLTPGISPEALAAAPAVAPAADMGPAVLGARRVDAPNGSVLGARKALDQAVLGKRRAPQTGDDSMIIWMLALLASLAGAAASVLTLKKQK